MNINLANLIIKVVKNLFNNAFYNSYDIQCVYMLQIIKNRYYVKIIKIYIIKHQFEMINNIIREYKV